MNHAGFALALCIVASSGWVGAAKAQDFPTKPVRFVVGFAAGANDAVARIVGQKLAESWGQNVVVENRPGAGGTIAAELVVKAQPDGYTLFVGEFGPNVVARSLFPKLPYDPATDFAHVTGLVTFPLVLVVPASSPAASLKDLIEQAKSKPGMLKYSTGGIGSSPHLIIALMNLTAHIDTVPVHYRGGAPSLVGLIGAEVDYTMLSIATALPQLGAGRVRALGVTSPKAIARLPNVPPIASVLPGYEAAAHHGLHAPKNTPKAIVVKLYQDVSKMLHRPEVKERFDELGMDVSGSTPEQFTAFIRNEIKTWTAVAQAANVRAD